MVAGVLGVDGEHQLLAQVEPAAALVRPRLVVPLGLGLGGARETSAQAELGRHRVIVPGRPVVGAEHLDQLGRPVVRDLGDAEVPVLGGMAARPYQLAAPPRASGGRGRTSIGRAQGPRGR